MKTLLVTDVRVLQYEGRYYLNRIAFGTILERYASQFGQIRLLARVVNISELDPSLSDYTDMVDEFILIRSYKELVKPSFREKIRGVLKDVDLVILRNPAIASNLLLHEVRRQKKPYLAEAMGCAWDSFFNHSTAGKALAPVMFWQMKRVFRHADYALYVTNRYLQEKYPCTCPSVGVSNVRISEPDPAVLQKRLDRPFAADHVRLMTTAAVDVRFKGQEYVIRALKLLREKGIQADYELAGGGDQSCLKGIAQQEGVADSVHFLGRLTRDEVFAHLDEADIYLQPSLQEGLPRAVIEAMSRGCPVIGARTAGIPELIAPECVVKRKSAAAIADAVVRLMDRQKMRKLAQENFDAAKEYVDVLLDERRNGFFERIRKDLEG